MNFKQFAAALAFCLPVLFLSAQSKAPENWFTLDQKADDVQGTSADQALAALKAKGKKGKRGWKKGKKDHKAEGAEAPKAE